MPIDVERELDQQAELIAPGRLEELQRLGRRWVRGILAVQASIIGIAACGLWAYWMWPVVAAAVAIWPLSIVIAPMIVTFACVFTAESSTRTAASVGLSLLLAMLPAWPLFTRLQ